MKFLSLICFLVLFCGCVITSPERLQKAEEYEERADAANKRAESHGELAGTPENIEGIDRATDQSIAYRESADEAKYSNTWIDVLISIFKD